MKSVLLTIYVSYCGGLDIDSFGSCFSATNWPAVWDTLKIHAWPYFGTSGLLLMDCVLVSGAGVGEDL